MPNYCNYDMRIAGKADKVQKLCDWLRAYYAYNDETTVCNTTRPDEMGEFDTEHHIGYRNFKFDYYNEFLKECDDNDDVVISGNGYCAWSVGVCMFDIPRSYLQQNEIQNTNAISLPNACKALGLKVELFSNEPGVCLSEHCYINNGDIVIFESTPYIEFEGGQSEYYETYDPELGITESEFEGIKTKLQSMSDGEWLIYCKWYNDEGNEGWEWQYF